MSHLLILVKRMPFLQALVKIPKSTKMLKGGFGGEDEHQHKLLLSAVIHDHGTFAKPGFECCDERLTVKAPGHSEFMKIGELDKIISVNIGML